MVFALGKVAETTTYAVQDTGGGIPWLCLLKPKDTLLTKPGVASMEPSNAGGDLLVAMVNANAQLTAEIARLHTEVSRLTAIESASRTPEPTPQGKETITIGCGSGAGSPEVFQEITKKNWHGRLGRTHMMDVDCLPDTAKQELDCFLRRKLMALFPPGGKYTRPDPDTIFATLSAFGLRLEDRGQLADVPTVNCNSLINSPTTRRIQNYAAYCFGGGNYENYWAGSALETLLELARYRGLFDKDGLIKAT